MSNLAKRCAEALRKASPELSSLDKRIERLINLIKKTYPTKADKQLAEYVDKKAILEKLQKERKELGRKSPAQHSFDKAHADE